jgi:hypothetical protein
MLLLRKLILKILFSSMPGIERNYHTTEKSYSKHVYMWQLKTNTYMVNMGCNRGGLIDIAGAVAPISS